ncbi:uncharacterized protein [Palaemon carinicauda]
MVRNGGILLLLWSLCSWQVWASPPGCDVDGLRCEVICSFPDLTLQCTRCLNRRPMRFGKRSKRSTKIRNEFPDLSATLGQFSVDLDDFPLRDFYDPDEESSMAVRMTSSWSPELKRDLETNEGKKFTPDLIRVRKKSTFQQEQQEEKRKRHRDFSRNFPYYYSGVTLPGQLPENVPASWSSMNEQLTQHPYKFIQRRANRNINEKRLTTQGYADTQSSVLQGFSSLTPQGFEEARDQKFERDPFPLNEKWKRITGTRKGYFPTAKRSKRSVQEVIEDLMILLGLEELPVDPKLYGCQEVILPVSSDSYLVLDKKK